MMALAPKLDRHLRIVAPAAALTVVLVVALGGSGHGDSRQTGLIDGRVVDAAGAALAGVTVRLAGDRGEHATVTDADGRFLFGPLAAGDYVAAVELAGSASTRKRCGSRPASAARSTSISTSTPRRGSTSSPPLRWSTPIRPASSSTLDADAASELVFATRNYQAVIASLPGVAHRATSLAEAIPHVNGGLWQENSGFVDGVDITDSRFGGGLRFFLPTSALAEVRSRRLRLRRGVRPCRERRHRDRHQVRNQPVPRRLPVRGAEPVVAVRVGRRAARSRGPS